MKKSIILIFGLLNITFLMAQNNSYSLKQCIDYAIGSSPEVKNSTIDVVINDNKTKEVRSKILPHVDAEADYLHNFNIQKIILENGVIPAFSNPMIPYGQVIAFQLQLKNSITGSVNASQVIFDKSLFSTLNSAKLYKELADQNLKKTKVDVIEMVTKAYYGVLVTQQQVAFLESNLQRIDSVYKETEARFKSGLVRQIDLYRIEVAMNNIKEEKEKALQNLLLSKAVLAFQMNIDKPEDIILSDTLNESSLYDAGNITDAKIKYTDRLEYSILQTQQQISIKNTNVAKGAFYPRLSAFATSGYNPAATNASDLFQSTRYFNYTYVGARLQIPIFSGFEKNYKLRNELLAEEKLKNKKDRTEKLINLEVQQAQINYTKSLESIKIQKRNLNLAQENLKSIKIENEKGIVNNIEVTNAESDLRLAQNNYYNTLYQAFIAKVDFDKATGKLNN
ncbi:MAG: TolC family protein [Bacteroidia bacterium]